MKKIGLIICTMFLLTGCLQNDKKMKEQLKEAATSYYHKYASTYEIDEYSVNLKQLKQAKRELSENYDLSEVEKCSDDTKVVLKIKNKKVEKTEIKLNCKR